MKLLEYHSGNHPSNSGVTMEKHNRINGFGEKGSALLLTLGILSLVMLMAMSFAFSSRTTRHVAKVNADLTAASLHSETGVDRAVGLMDYMLARLDVIGNTINDPTLSLYPARRNLETTLGGATGVNPVEAALYGQRFNFSAHKFTYQPGGSGNPYVTQHMWGYTNEASNGGTPQKDDSVEAASTPAEDRRSFYYTLLQEVPGFEAMYINQCVDTNSAGDWPAFEGSDRGTKTEAIAYLQDIGFQTIWSGGEVVGRLGYLVLEEGHKMDINQLLTLRKRASGGDLPLVKYNGIALAGLDEQWLSAENDYYFNITGDYNPEISLTNETATTRLGVHVQELNVGNAYYTRLFNGIDAKIGWQSYDHLWKGMIPGDVPNSYAAIVNASDYKEDHALFTFFSAEEPESWRYTDDDAEYARFDITGYEWRPDKAATATSKYYGAGNKPSGATDASGWSKTCTSGADKEAMVNTLAFVQADGTPKADADIPAFSADPANASECIPALADMVEDADDPSGSGKRSVARQVAANMIDYCDGDNRATLEDGYYPDVLTAAEDAVEPPKFCGNEKVAYFNELGLRFAITRIFQAASNSYLHRIQLKPKIELCNMFNEEVPKGDVRVRIIGKSEIESCNYSGPGGHSCGYTQPATEKSFDSDRFDIAQSGTIAGNTIYFDGVEGIDLSILEFTESGNTESGNVIVPPLIPGVVDYKAPEIVVKLRIEKIVLVMEESADNAYDIGYWEADECEEAKQKFVMRIIFPEGDGTPDENISDVYFFASLEANDPRCNHRTIGWKWRKHPNEADDGYNPANADEGGDFTKRSVDEDDYGSFSTLGDKNQAFVIPDHGVDVEKNATDVNEISTNFIRNAPFETMWELGAIHRGEPFRTINLSQYTDPDSTHFDGSYEKGDAHILDQVKIGPLKYSRGRFNINSGNKDALDFLVSNKFGEEDTYDNYNGWPAGSDLALPTWVTDLPPGFHRGRFANMIAGTSYDAFDNDRQMESFIGRTANLLTTRSEAYSVIVVSQALKDLFLELDTVTAREAQFNALKHTFINPTVYEAYKSGAAETHYCDILGTNVTMANLVRDGWTGETRVVKKVKLNKD